MNKMSPYQHARHSLAIGLEGIGAVLTAASKDPKNPTSKHPFVVERQGPQGIERGFKLKLHEKNPDAPLSPYFFNLRTPDNPKPGPLKENLVLLAACCMHQLLSENGVEYEAIAGVPRAGDPFAKALQTITGKPLIKLEKWEGDGKRHIAGLTGNVPMEIGSVLLMDDLVTGADSKIEALEVLREAGIEVSDVVVLIDREQGGREELDEWRCNLHSVFSVTELFDLYAGAGKISPQLRADIDAYRALPA